MAVMTLMKQVAMIGGGEGRGEEEAVPVAAVETLGWWWC